MADIDLPVFSLLPNWRDGITERLEWLTDVMRSSSGHEQRRSLRNTPRRFFEAAFNPVDNHRTYLDLWLSRFGEQEFLLPLWHDRAKMTANVASTAERLPIDNTYREFETGGVALIYQDLFNFEAVQISAQDDTGLDLALPVVGDYAKGTIVFPARAAWLENPEERLAALTSRVGDADLTFRLSGPNPYDAGAEVLDLYDDVPVLVREPNRAESLRLQFERIFEDMDTQLGSVYRVDEAGHAFTTQFHDWQAHGRQARHELRQALYRLHGKQKPLWVPTFNRDVQLAADLVTGSTDLDIQQCGFTYLGGPAPGRDHLLLYDENNAARIVEIADTDAAPALGQERLTLAAALDADVREGTYGSFVRQMRLDQDVIEITHHTDSDGACEAAAAMKSFTAGRDPSGTLIDPIPVAEMNSIPCGAEVVSNPNLIPSVHAASNITNLNSTGLLISGFNPSDVLYLILPADQPYGGWSPWGSPNITGPSTGTRADFWVIPDGIPGDGYQVGPNGLYNGYAAARAAFGVQTITGASTYRFGVIDSPIGDNSGGFEILIYKL